MLPKTAFNLLSLCALATSALALPASPDALPEAASLDKRGGFGGGGFGGVGVGNNRDRLRVDAEDKKAAAAQRETAFAVKDERKKKAAALDFELDKDVAIFREDLHIEYVKVDADERAKAAALKDNRKKKAAFVDENAAAAARKNRLDVARTHNRNRFGEGGYGGGFYKRQLDEGDDGADNPGSIDKRGFGGGYGDGFGGGFGGGYGGGYGGFGGRGSDIDFNRNSRTHRNRLQAFDRNRNSAKNQRLNFEAVKLNAKNNRFRHDRTHAVNFDSANRHRNTNFNADRFGRGGFAGEGFGGGGYWKRQAEDVEGDDAGDDAGSIEKRAFGGEGLGYGGGFGGFEGGGFEGGEFERGGFEGGEFGRGGYGGGFDNEFYKRQVEEAAEPTEGDSAGEDSGAGQVEKRQIDDVGGFDGGLDGGADEALLATTIL